MKKIILMLLAGLFTVAGCGSAQDKVEVLLPTQAKAIMESGERFVLLDVRTEEEYKENGHIKDAILIPDFELKEKVEGVISDKNELILVYCRSGRRSNASAKVLSSMGYTNVKDIGGIMNWPYDVER